MLFAKLGWLSILKISFAKSLTVIDWNIFSFYMLSMSRVVMDTLKSLKKEL